MTARHAGPPLGPGGEAPGRILVVDDEPLNRDLLAQELDEMGLAVIEAADGEAALEMMRAERPDVVLLDLVMPKADGFDVLAAAAASPELAEIPIIVISSLHDLSSVVRGIGLGAVDHLPKPFEPVILKARIETSLERVRARRRERAYLAEIERERRRSDELLHALLPDEAVQELRRHGRVAPRSHDRVAVMFLDIVTFSETVRRSPPEAIVALLTRFTEEAERQANAHGLEKIKLVGDAVMITGNLLRAHSDPAGAAVDCALALIEETCAEPGGRCIRGGLALGSVISGIIGRERFAFDLWGHTVNMAARLAALPGAGVIHLDAAAAEAIGPRPGLARLGESALKGVGAVTVHRLGPGA